MGIPISAGVQWPRHPPEARAPMTLFRFFLRLWFRGNAEPTRVAGKWMSAVFIPRIGDTVHYGNNYPADCAQVFRVELHAWEDDSAGGLVVVDAEELDCHELAEVAEDGRVGTDYFVGRAAVNGFRPMTDDSDYWPPEDAGGRP